MAKDGDNHPSEVRSWQPNAIAFDDAELNEWLMQAIEESSEQFLPALAEAALVACAEEYCLLRPALINFKRRYSFASPAERQTKQR